jgi:hypothetical protein
MTAAHRVRSALHHLGLVTDSGWLLRREVPKGPAGTTTLAAVQIPSGKDIATALAEVGNPTPEARITGRLRQGLTFHAFMDGGAVAATTWLALSGERFLDEAMLAAKIGADMAWLRDVFVQPARRGRRLFGAAIAALEAGPLAGRSTLWSFVEATNTASLRAHRKLEFWPVGHIRSLALFDRLMLRQMRLDVPLEWCGYRPGDRLLFLDAEARSYRTAHLA